MRVPSAKNNARNRKHAFIALKNMIYRTDHLNQINEAIFRITDYYDDREISIYEIEL